ncbi:hypothetical protein [Pontivivens ytuae]|uniref:Haloacid dehalogenase-like hydrolase n=1 Tax=Pontivivens ytuae TaxID=2789856 RepID=A0A7S9QAZ3_9RHOB|nr:hypothetical protein [Pontivivens ytuae]QPH52608.1 hypothetical protein I0K15_12370 [Pontivivens ytuae]
MRIGIDFDNTIACYDGVFHRAAVDRGLIPPDVGMSKNAVRDHLNSSGRKEAFTELQGWIYGPGMDLVSPYPGFDIFVDAAVGVGHAIFIVSHKTRTPLAGPAYDLHSAARNFLDLRDITGPNRIAADAIFFEETKEAKVARIGELDCDVFIDDLPEILTMRGFPDETKALLFDPLRHHNGDHPALHHVGSWEEIGELLITLG